MSSAALLVRTDEAVKVLHIWRPSGEKAASISISDQSLVHELKQHLHLHLGVPRFRQRIVHEDVVLDDDAQLASITDVPLVVLDFCHTSEEGAKDFVRAVEKNSDTLVVEMLQKCFDPNLTADFGNTPLLAAARAGRKGMVSIWLEAGARDVDQLALRWAASGNHQMGVLRVLLVAGGDRFCGYDSRVGDSPHVVRKSRCLPHITTPVYRESLVAVSSKSSFQFSLENVKALFLPKGSFMGDTSLRHNSNS